MDLTETDIVRVHASLGSVEEIVEQRRAIYLAAVELVTDVPVAEIGADVVDNPAVRGHLGTALTAGGICSSDALRSVDELVVDGCSFAVADGVVRIASSPTASVVLRGAVTRISDELRRHNVELSQTWLLTAEDPAFAEVCRVVVEGIQLATDAVPEMAKDLLPHVAVIAVLAQHEWGRLGSASAREFPGLVMIPRPASAFEVAEAIVHEGAHQKLFDLALTRPVLGAKQYSAEGFRPSWAKNDAPPWPMEQCVAAFHAYCCLRAFAAALGGDIDYSAHPLSLLPKAADRSEEIADWLLLQGSFIQVDGHALLEGLTGRTPLTPADSVVEGLTPLIDDSAIVRPCGSRTLIARRSHPADLVWVPTEQVRHGV